MPRLPLASADPDAERIAELKALFPEAFADGKINFDRLRLALGDAVDTGRERYGLTWAGKADAIRAIQIPSAGTLTPDRDQSVNFDSTENLIIEGDNLEALKLLQNSYYGKVKMIYIDPPYNTGNEFIYPDNFREGLHDYLRYSGQVQDDGTRVSSDEDKSGRFHSRWLSMMYPRLFLAKNLLREDGVIFVSIDYHEVHSLRLMMNEIFGEENLVADVANVNNPKGRSDEGFVATAHESLLIYKRGVVKLNGWKPEANILKRYKPDSDGKLYRMIDLRKTGDNDRREDRQNLFYSFMYNQTTKHCYATRDEIEVEGYVRIIPLREDGSEGNWRWELKTAQANISSLQPSIMPKRRVWTVYEIDRLQPDELIKPTSAWTKPEFNSERGSEQFLELGFDKSDFPNPKPVGTLKRIMELGTSATESDIVLDFFAGSGAMGQAVMELNQEDGGNRKFILVQLPEKTDHKQYPTIAHITRERVRRVGLNLIKSADSPPLPIDEKPALDVGFKAFRLTASNFKVWDGAETGEPLEAQLEAFASNLRPEATPESMLCEIMLKAGLELGAKRETLTLGGQPVEKIGDGSLLVCLEPEIGRETLRAMIAARPRLAVCLDTALHGDDALLTNAELEAKAAGVTFYTV